MLQLTNEQKALFALLGAKFEIDGETDWSKVQEEAMAQAVYLLAANSPKRPENVSFSRMLPFITANFKSFYAVTELDRIMKAHNLRYLILKGVSSAMYYPEYMQRILGDCDFLIDREQRDQVEKILESEGYEKHGESHVHHTEFRKPDQDLEMHFDIPGVPGGEKGNIVHEYIKNMLSETVPQTIQGYNLFLPLPKYHGLILLLHMQNHMISSGIGLRHLMDWCVFVDQTYQESFWEDDLLPLLKKIGMYKYAQIMTKTGHIYLHTACPEWCRSGEDDLCDGVMSDILLGGNFGRKSAERSQSGKMLSVFGKSNNGQHSMIYNMWSQVTGLTRDYHFHTIKKYPFLYPVFIIEFVSKRIWHVLTGKRPSVFKSSKYMRERKSVYDRLEIFK